MSWEIYQNSSMPNFWVKSLNFYHILTKCNQWVWVIAKYSIRVQSEQWRILLAAYCLPVRWNLWDSVLFQFSFFIVAVTEILCNVNLIVCPNWNILNYRAFQQEIYCVSFAILIDFDTWILIKESTTIS